jgi:hypothetical protein
VKQRCLQRINLLKSVAGVSWGTSIFHLVCFCYIGVSLATRQWPGHTCYCLNAFSIEHCGYQNSLRVLSGILPLRHRLFYLNFRYLVNTFQKNGHLLRDRLEKLYDLSPQKCLIALHEVSGLDIQPEVGFTRHELEPILSSPRVNRHMEVALSGAHVDMYMLLHSN